MHWYSGNSTYDTVLVFGFVLVVLVLMAGIAKFQSPYGRFGSSKFGLSLSPRLGWMLMELPATLSFVYFFTRGERSGELVPLVFLAVWLIHYGNRGFVFPALMRVPKGAKPTFSMIVVTSGWLVTSIHGYLNASFITTHGSHYDSSWFGDPRFIVGICIYYLGFFGILHSEWIQRNLRSKEEVAAGERVYRIPRGGLYRWVTNAPYLAELVAWTGFAIATWCLGSVFVLAVSAANLIPRAIATHGWYQKRFSDYPKERRILIPFVW